MSEVRDNAPAVPAQRTASNNHTRSPDQIAADLAAARVRLANTVDTLVERAHPRHLRGQAVTKARGLAVTPDGELRTRRLIKIGVGAAGLVACLWGLRRMFHD